MYPVVRLLTMMLRAPRASRVSITEVSEYSFICRPWDVDMFLELNNGRTLTIYDLGRFDMSIRNGFSRVLKEKRWGLVVAGGSVRYRKRVRMFDKVTMRTQIVYFDEKWVYIVQSMWVKGQATSSVLLRTGVTEKGKVVTTDRVLNAMGQGELELEAPDWVRGWIEADDERPWPPV